MINNQYEIKYIIIQVFLTLFIAFIPIYFYLDASFENQAMKDKMNLKNFASSVILKIEFFEKENSTIFYFPRSNIFKAAIYDNENEVIFSLLRNNDINFENEFTIKNDLICYKEYLFQNILNAKSLIVCKEVDNSEVIYNSIILLLSISFFIFLSSFFIIKQSVEPYRQLNQYLDDFLKDVLRRMNLATQTHKHLAS